MDNKMKNQSSPSKSLKNQSSASTDEEDSVANEKIIESVTSKYTEFECSDLLGKTLEHLRENIKAGICLICIEDVERNEAIWSCDSCYCILHLVCIQRWAKDSIANVKEAAAYKGFNLPLVWCCPKCRGEYGENDFPDRYKCFCGKLTNPAPDPWNAPHSCGDSCGKPLKPECGHYCLLLCHSGQCPPCPKQVENSCHCGQSSPKTLRCFSKTWSCGQICSKNLPCNHKCTSVCHENPECPDCMIPQVMHCRCSSPTKITIPCSKLTSVTEAGLPEFPISCGEICNLKLNCGVHKCLRTCHEDPCGDCEQSCPCGKKRAPCSGELRGIGKPCEDTCDKGLDCGDHRCTQKCHAAGCGSCLQYVPKTCKCGQFEKEVLCSKEFTCTQKCRKTRDCGVHPCNKKCCPGDCPPCRNPCSKTLSCKNHKCESLCHRGPCYPCPVAAQVKCRCGKTVRSVPCGSERKCKPPGCLELCERSSKCDHPKIQNHRCHFGDCPKCRLVCSKEMTCGHRCPALCHSARPKSEPNAKKRECPKCAVLVASLCTLHSDVKVPCNLKDSRCQELCGKQLGCGCENHMCLKKCHEEVLKDGCGDCNEACSKKRPNGCEHECPLGCHQDKCPECNLVAKTKCHCEAETLFITCSLQSKLSEAEKSCKNQCPKKLSCGHRCLSICHSGPCTELDRCRRKVKLICKCRHLKKEVECFLVGEIKTLECAPPTCAIPKSPKDTPGGTKKRTRKKKTSESEKEAASQLLEDENSSKTNYANKNDQSTLPLAKIVVIVIAISAAIAAAYFGSSSD